MRRLTAIILCAMLIVSLAAAASAATGASAGTFSANVSGNGSCQVTLDLQLRVESADPDMTFPLPKNARSITLNGSSARTSRSGDVLLVKLSSLVGKGTGVFTARLQYTLPNVVEYDDAGKLMLTLPLLSGFSYPIESLSFQISLPGEIQGKPFFTSGYYQQTIESSLNYTVSGSSISGTVSAELKDRETMTMTLEVPEELFPQSPSQQWSMGVSDVAMIVLAVLALVYWIVFMRCAPFLRAHSATAPEGRTAGEFSAVLFGSGSDLTMMVLSWAQLGYILIHVQDSGRVTLHKRMDMGNERSAYELRIFRNLFGKRTMLDGTGYHYANLCRKVAATPGETRDLFRRSTGNPRVFRLLCAGIGLCGGISLGSALAGSALLGFLLVFILAVLGAASAWLIQDWIYGWHLHDKKALYLALGLSLAWVVLGIGAGIVNVTACVAGAQLLCGLMAGYGGRRTATGRQTVSQILGLRHYLKKLSPEQAQHISRSDPDYFFDMAPYAMALGVQKPFAASFRSKRLGACPYLTTGMDGHMNAAEWAHLMERAVTALDARQKRLPLERLMGR